VVAGVAPAEACKVFGKLGDALGSYRPDIELIWWFNHDTLKDISGAAEVFGHEIWELMGRHDNVFVTSNLGERHNFECVVGDARVEIIFCPDRNGDYMPGIRAAQAEEEDAVLLTMWTGRAKRNADRTIKQLKGRAVLRGDLHKCHYAVDQNQTHSPVVRNTSMTGVDAVSTINRPLENLR
jgi:hypothetical protein